MARLPHGPSERPHHKHPATFAEIRRKAEKRLARGLKLDFDQIMLDIAVIRARADKLTKN
jgi:hypothetical protein